jgi:predicted DNA-binding ribbon-helix-helix protein
MDGLAKNPSPSFKAAGNLWNMARRKSAIIKRSIILAGHKTSISLEDQFWNALKEIAERRKITVSDLVTGMKRDRKFSNLSSTIRLFVLDFYRDPHHRSRRI